MTSAILKKVLIVTYYWPPAGGPGVQRVLKFAKYLPEFGWQPIILTVKNGEFPAIDETLKKEIPEDCIVYQTNSWEPNAFYKNFIGLDKNSTIPVAVLSSQKDNWKKRLSAWIRLNFFIPDAKIGWIPFAVREGKKIIREHQPDVIFSSSPPPTVHLIARKLAKWSGIKWVADFRDPWTKIHYYSDKRSNIASRFDRRKEKTVVSSVDGLTVASRQFVRLISADQKNNVSVITNGYDESDLVVKNPTRNKAFTLVHIGGINQHRFYPAFFNDLNKLISRNIIPEDRIKLRFLGKIEPGLREQIVQSIAPFQNIEFSGYVTHHEAVQAMYSGDLLLLFLENISDYSGHIPGKLFEYLATGNYVLGIGDPTGDAAEILADTNCGKVYSENTDFGPLLSDLYKRWTNSALRRSKEAKIGRFSRYELTRSLVTIFNQVQ